MSAIQRLSTALFTMMSQSDICHDYDHNDGKYLTLERNTSERVH